MSDEILDAQPVRNRARKIQWEYRILFVSALKGAFSGGNARATEEQLNDLGEDGWELVSFVPAVMGSGAKLLAVQQVPRTFVATFKRQAR